MNAAELTTELNTLVERVTNLQKNQETAGEAMLRLEARVRQLEQELANFRGRVDEHIKRTETWDNRRWAVFGLFIASTLSLLANLIVIVLRK